MPFWLRPNLRGRVIKFQSQTTFGTRRERGWRPCMCLSVWATINVWAHCFYRSWSGMSLSSICLRSGVDWKKRSLMVSVSKILWVHITTDNALDITLILAVLESYIDPYPIGYLRMARKMLHEPKIAYIVDLCEDPKFSYRIIQEWPSRRHRTSTYQFNDAN